MVIGSFLKVAYTFLKAMCGLLRFHRNIQKNLLNKIYVT
jgi:hypothetical protein